MTILLEIGSWILSIVRFVLIFSACAGVTWVLTIKLFDRWAIYKQEVRDRTAVDAYLRAIEPTMRRPTPPEED